MSNPTVDLEPLVVSPRQACRLLDISIAHLYTLLQSKEIESFNLGRSRRIPMAAIRRYVSHQVAASLGKRPRGRPRKPLPQETAAPAEATGA